MAHRENPTYSCRFLSGPTLARFLAQLQFLKRVSGAKSRANVVLGTGGVASLFSQEAPQLDGHHAWLDPTTQRTLAEVQGSDVPALVDGICPSSSLCPLLFPLH